ncbi:citrate synthase family protein [Mycobacterium kansasii 732]|nr:citrate synthase family protein [Mycobacterium kansasii 732]
MADVVGRHDSLRTVFSADGIPRQPVLSAAKADFGWQIIDAAEWPASRLGEAIADSARHPFDSSNEIPFWAMVFRITDREHVLVITVRHRWSRTPSSGRWSSTPNTASTSPRSWRGWSSPPAPTSTVPSRRPPGLSMDPQHGGANEAVMRDMSEIGSATRAAEWLNTKLARYQKVMGFGHRVYPNGDSRVPAWSRP